MGINASARYGRARLRRHARALLRRQPRPAAVAQPRLARRLPPAELCVRAVDVERGEPAVLVGKRDEVDHQVRRAADTSRLLRRERPQQQLGVAHGRVYEELFAQLAARGGHRVGVVRVAPPAGEAVLSWVAHRSQRRQTIAAQEVDRLCLAKEHLPAP
jgi:hypothetical protein